MSERLEEVQNKIERLERQLNSVRGSNSSREEINVQSKPIEDEIRRLATELSLPKKVKKNNGVYDLEGLAEIFIESGVSEGKYATVAVLSSPSSDFCLKNSPWIIGNRSPLALAVKETPVGGTGDYVCKSRANGTAVQNSIRVMFKSEGINKSKWLYLFSERYLKKGESKCSPF